MNIWKPLSSAQEPSTKLVRWSVYEVDGDFRGAGKTIHFVGYTGYEGRVSSPIQSYDKETHTGVSRSGRNYTLVGPRGYDRDALYTFSNWIAIHDNPAHTDISGEYE